MGFIAEGNDDLPLPHGDDEEIGITAEVEMALISRSARGSVCCGAPSGGVAGGGIEAQQAKEQVSTRA